MDFEDINPKFKIWLSKNDGSYVLGGGAAKLLRAIQETNDLGKAGEKINISYRKAWNIIQKIKKNLGDNPVISHRGGKGGGGGMKLSKTGEKLLMAYDLLESSMNKALKEFSDVFNDI